MSNNIPYPSMQDHYNMATQLGIDSLVFFTKLYKGEYSWGYNTSTKQYFLIHNCCRQTNDGSDDDSDNGTKDTVDGTNDE